MEVNRIIKGDCLTGLKGLPDESINCCVTSPPYYGLRDYGMAEQIGLEDTPEAFVAKLVEVFTEVRRVLKPEGTLWLNIGDSYANDGKSGGSTGGKHAKALHGNTGIGRIKKHTGLKPKDLIGIPWLVAFALRSAGWYLRQDIIWSKPNPMPESVTDRCTKAHEYIFLLSKSQKYYYNADAIKLPIQSSTLNDSRLYKNEYQAERVERGYPGSPSKGKGLIKPVGDISNANKRSVWTVTTKPFSEAHFATFPEDLIVDCIKAGCPEGGIVLDPFSGAGTTALVASKLNRNYIGFELNEQYIKITENRLRNELGMFNKSIQ